MLQIQQIIDHAKAIHDVKNRDYGDSFSITMTKYGTITAAIRLDDKLNRYRRITGYNPEVKTESCFDTLLDMFNYALMGEAYISTNCVHTCSTFDQLANSMIDVEISAVSYDALDACIENLQKYATVAKKLDSEPKASSMLTGAEAMRYLYSIAANALLLLTKFDESDLIANRQNTIGG